MIDKQAGQISVELLHRLADLVGTIRRVAKLVHDVCRHHFSLTLLQQIFADVNDEDCLWPITFDRARSRYSGFTQTATRTVEGNRPQTIFLIHVSKDLLEQGQTEMVAANIVHELSHSAYRSNQIGQAMQKFDTDLAGLLVDHPQIAALRSSATDPAALRNVHLSRIRQMLYEVTGYGEEEIFVHLQQLTHQPSMTVNTTTIRGSDFILQQVELLQVNKNFFF